MPSRIIALLEKGLLAPAGEKGYSALGPFSERHGSWEMRFCRGADLNRFAVFAMTPAPPSVEDGAVHYDTEVWTGADRGNRYTRFVAWSYTIEKKQLRHKKEREQLLGVLIGGLRHGMAAADRITASDLTEAYLSDEAEQRVA